MPALGNVMETILSTLWAFISTPFFVGIASVVLGLEIVFLFCQVIISAFNYKKEEEKPE